LNKSYFWRSEMTDFTPSYPVLSRLIHRTR
jgi:hypothetical protein